MSFDIFIDALSPLSTYGFDKLEEYTEKDAYIISTLTSVQESIILNRILN